VTLGPGIVIIGLIGFVAQLVDGALGMGYGVTSTTLLLTAGLAPAAASATVHMAEIGTTAVSGVAHWRFGNVNLRAVALLAVPGAIGGFLGAVVLSNLAADTARPWVSLILGALGILILARAIKGTPVRTRAFRPRLVTLGPLGVVAGFIDATGGGGWGPVTTSTLMAANRMEPRRVIGSVSASEFLVALGASTGFLLTLGTQAIAWDALAVLLLGGMVAAPVAAWLVRHLDHRLLGVVVAGMILFSNVDRALALFGVGPTVGLVARGLIVIGTVALFAWLWRRTRDPLATADAREHAGGAQGVPSTGETSPAVTT
jgi:uncharacterized membrane protein YfcA